MTKSKHHRLLQLFASGLFSSGIPKLPVRDGLIIELDAWALSTLWQNSAMTTPVTASGNPVGAWVDRTGNGYTPTQGSTAAKPTWQTNVQNGRGVVRFDGADDALRKTSFPDFGDVYTIFAVGKFDATGDTSQGLYSVSNASGGSGFEIYQGGNTVSNMRDATVERAVGTVNYRDDNFYIFNQVNSGSLNSFYVDNLSAQSIAYTAPNPNTLSQLDIGRVLYAGWFFKGDIGHFSIYNRALSTNERILNRGYLNTLWNCF